MTMERLWLSAGHQSASNWLGAGFSLSAITFLFFLPPFCSFHHTVLFFSWPVYFSFVSRFMSISIKTLLFSRLLLDCFSFILVSYITYFHSLIPITQFFSLVVFFYSPSLTQLSPCNCLFCLSFVIFSPLPLPIPFSVSVQGPHQRFLLRELLNDYNPMERPVANDSQALTVQFSFILIQVMDVVCMAKMLHKHNYTITKRYIAKVIEGQLLMIITLMPFRYNIEIHWLQSLFPSVCEKDFSSVCIKWLKF